MLREGVLNKGRIEQVEAKYDKHQMKVAKAPEGGIDFTHDPNLKKEGERDIENEIYQFEKRKAEQVKAQEEAEWAQKIAEAKRKAEGAAAENTL